MGGKKPVTMNGRGGRAQVKLLIYASFVCVIIPSARRAPSASAPAPAPASSRRDNRARRTFRPRIQFVLKIQLRHPQFSQ